MKSLFHSFFVAAVGMSFIHSLGTKRTFSRSTFSHGLANVLRVYSSVSEHSSPPSTVSEQIVLEENDKEKWVEYMIEFRGTQSEFRLNEFRDAYKYVMKGKEKNEIKEESELEFATVIADVLEPSIPVCAYVRLPNESIAVAVTKRCALVRSCSQVWGNARTIEEVRTETEGNYQSMIAPIFNGESLEDNSWRVDFRRYGRAGRSGLDPQGKKNALQTFSGILKAMRGVVRLSDAKHNLLYLEDWSSYRLWTLGVEQREREEREIQRELERLREVARGEGEVRREVVEKEGENEVGKVEGREIGSEGVMKVEKERRNISITNNSGNSTTSNSMINKKIHKNIRKEKEKETWEENRLRRVTANINRNNAKNLSSIGDSHKTDSEENNESGKVNGNDGTTDHRLIATQYTSNNIIRKQNKDHVPSEGEINHDDGTYVPLKCVLSRIVAEGPCVVSDFDLRRRPYLGTTTMDPVVSHLAAVAAHASWNQTVLDPFCGTGSLLIACASLGARVVGSDVDGDCLGLGPEDAPLKARSKNTRFLRHGSNNVSQEGKSTVDNMIHYGLQERLIALVGVDAAVWAVPMATSSGSSSPSAGAGAGAASSTSSSSSPLSSLSVSSSSTTTTESSEKRIGWNEDLDQYGLFDAIVTDPPYSKRERGVSLSPSSSSPPSEVGLEDPMGDTFSTTSCLLALASHRLKSGGRLVFWLPTVAFVSDEEVRYMLTDIEEKAQTFDSASTGLAGAAGVGLPDLGLRLERVTAERLNTSLWRWLCVYHRV